jgi:hypothetical protein
MMECRNCKHWGCTEEEREYYRLCQHDKVGGGAFEHDGCEAKDNYGLITGPDFGCVQFEIA